MDNVKISVIVPMYNVEVYVTRCLDSIVNQTYKNLEIILIDDGSPDRCGEIAGKYANKDERIKVIHQTNKGLCAARNRGINEATGDYIAFVDADDYIAINMYEEMIKAIEENLDYIVCNWFEVVDGIEIKNDVVYDDIIVENDEILSARCALFGNVKAAPYLNQENFDAGNIFVGPWNKLYRRDFLRENDLSFDEKLKAQEDIWFNYQVIKKTNRIKILNESYYYYVINTQSITQGFKKNRIELNEELSSRIVKDLGSEFYDNKDNIIVQSAYNEVLTMLIIDIKQYFIHTKNDEKFIVKRKQLKKLVEENDINRQAIKYINSKGYSKKRRLVVFFLKRRWYAILLLVSELNSTRKIRYS